MKRFLLPAAGLLLACLALPLWTRVPLADTTPPAASVRAVAVTAPAAVTATEAPTLAPSEPSASARPRRLARSELAQVLPGTPATGGDWRQFAPATLVVEPVPGLPLVFTAKSVTSDGKRTTWIGTNPEQGASLVACGAEDYWSAVLTIPGADEYTIEVSPTEVRVTEHTRSLIPCGVAEATRLDQTTVAAAPTTLSAADASYTVDLLILYDAATKTAAGTAAQLENTLTARLATMNTFLSNSAVDNLRWRLVGVVEAPSYPSTSVMEDDLKRLANPTTELGQFARSQRTTLGADQILLLITGDRGGTGGIAYTPGYLAVARYDQGAGTYAHELGHNFGCHHDRKQEALDAAEDGTTYSDNDGRYYYGYRFDYNNREYGTLMSYANPLVPYFSNPSVSYNGIALGIPAGQTKAADNARWLREHAADVADLVASKAVTMPVITAQPSSVTVTVGQTFSLSVTATGNALSYQWSKGGTDIPGATAATYSKVATTADAGTYSVLVTNTEGSVRSATATVTVNEPPPTNPGSGGNTGSGGGTNTGGGGGGGGGGGWITVLGLLALLAGGRRLRAKA